MFNRRKEKKNFQREIDLAIGLKMERFADANCEHFTSRSELKKISKSKINPEYASINLQQQAGYSAEVKQRARYNAEKIIQGKKDRIERTDNVGDVNHNKYDHINVDSQGKPILDSNGNYTGGSQQKNYSKPGNYKKLWNKDYEHYKGAPIDIPSDHYDPVMEQWKQQKEKRINQEKYLREQGKVKKADNIKMEIEKIDDTAKRLRKSKVSSSDAMEARKHYRISVAKDIGRISHKAGLKASKGSAVIDGAMSTVINTKALVDGEIDIEEALIKISADSLKSASRSYINAASASAVGGALKASNNQLLKNLSKKNGPVAIVSAGAILAKQTGKLVSGKVSAEEYANNIGKEGFSLASSLTGSNLGAIVGTAIFPGVGTVVGGFIGGMVASMLSSATYGELMKTIHDTKMSDKQRKIISEYCKKLKEDEIRYRNEMMEIFDIFFDEKESDIRNGFEYISEALANGESIHGGLALIADTFGVELTFSTADDFTEHIRKGKVLEL